MFLNIIYVPAYSNLICLNVFENQLCIDFLFAFIGTRNWYLKIWHISSGCQIFKASHIVMLNPEFATLLLDMAMEMPVETLSKV